MTKLRFTVAFITLFGLIQAQFDDYDFACHPGFKVTGIFREKSVGQRVGAMRVECTPLGGHPMQVRCEPKRNPYRCDGTVEGCTGRNEWLGGLRGFELDKNTGAVMFQPICCTAPNVVVDKAACESRRLNGIRGAFGDELVNDEVYTDVKCWRQYDLKNIVYDFIWKPTVCKYLVNGRLPVVFSNGRPETSSWTKQHSRSAFRSRRLRLRVISQTPATTTAAAPVAETSSSGRDLALCDKCSCECGPFRCPESRQRRFALVHKRKKRSSCQCVCDCTFKCVE